MRDTCRRELDDFSLCGGALSPAIRGTRTGRWLRTCKRCGVTMSSAIPPAEISDRPLGFSFPRDLPLTWQARLEQE